MSHNLATLLITSCPLVYLVKTTITTITTMSESDMQTVICNLNTWWQEKNELPEILRLVPHKREIWKTQSK